jgi:uncharacterized protein (TIGR03437 family)
MKICHLLLLAGILVIGASAQAKRPTCTPTYTDPNEFLPDGDGTILLLPVAEDTTPVLTAVGVTTGDMLIEYLLDGDEVRVDIIQNDTLTASIIQLATYNLTIGDDCGPGFQFKKMAQSRAKATLQANASSSSPPPSGKTNDGTAIGDFNGDGVLDGASITSSGIQVTLFNADGSVLSTATYPIAGIGPSIVAVDLNKDGVPDLAATETDPSGQGNLVVLLGKGDGTFRPPAKFAAGVYAFYLATADFNGDGAPDIAITNLPSTATGAGQVSVLLGKGDGTFGSPVEYPVGPAPATIVADDFNGDEKVDLVALDASLAAVNKVWFLPGNGNGTFGTPVSTASGTGSGYLAYTDLNHDGKLDLVIADEFASAAAIMLGNGDGSFQPAQEYAVSSQPVSIAAIPMGDGNTLILTGDSSDGNLVNNFVASNGTAAMPAIQTLGMGPAAIAAGDLNGDQQPDLVITDPAPGNVYVKLWTGKGQFGNPVTYSLGSQPGAVAIADLNGDGKLDVVAADAAGIDVLLGNGNGTLGAVRTFPASGSLSSIAVADFNGDGKPDVAAASAASGAVFLFLGNGDGTFQAAQNIMLGGGLVPLSAAAGDVNGDGKPDLIVAFNSSDRTQPGGVAVLLGKGDGTFQAPVNITLAGPLVQQATGSAASAVLTLGDLNGDGKLDVVTAFQGSLSNQVAVLLGNGNGTFQAPLLSNTNTAPPMIAIADINGDGKPDLVLGDCCGLSEASEMFGNGDGTFQAEVHFPSGPSPAAIAIADFEDSGWPDLAIAGQVQSPGRGTLSILSNPFRYVAIEQVATVISSANANAAGIAPGSLASAFGADLATGTPGSTSLPLPVTDEGTSVSILDASGKTTAAPLVYVSPKQVNFYVPPGIATGSATVTITSGDGTQSAATVQVAPVAPGVFELNSAGLAAADVYLYSGGTATLENVYSVNSAGAIVANPISLDSGTAYLVLYGTGFEAAGTAGVTVTVNGVAASVAYAGPQGTFTGLDQANVLLPASLAGKGNVTVQLTANGIAANSVNITIQ